MGQSKKKEKRWRKASARVGVKAKAKIRKSQQITARHVLQDSRRKAAEATGRGTGREAGREQGIDFSAMTGVDALFAGMCCDDGKHKSGGDAQQGFGADSKGILGVLDTGPDVDTCEVHSIAEDAEDGEVAGSHEEFRAIRESDTELFTFLVERRAQLLQFRVLADGCAEAGVGMAGPRLTRERLGRIRALAKDSLTACKAALNIFHTAARSIEGGRTAGGRAMCAFTLEDESLSEVIEWSIANFLGLLKSHAGEPCASSGATEKSKRGKRRHDEVGILRSADRVDDPSTFTHWPQVRRLAAIFWEETYLLLCSPVADGMLELVLRHISTPEALSWLWPLRVTRSKLLQHATMVWAAAPTQNVRLLSFLFLRNCAAMVMQAVDANDAMPQLEALVDFAVRAFITESSRSSGWQSVAIFRFMEDCLVELLRLEDGTAYRTAYVCLRHMALVLRNACLNVEHRRTGGNTKTNNQPSGVGGSTKEGDGSWQEQHLQALVGWPFVRSLALWTRAVSSLKSLRPLAYPLCMISLGAAKHRLSSLEDFPFVYHCLSSLNQLGCQLEAFVPLSSHVLRLLGILSQAMERAHKGRRQGEARASERAPDIELCLSFGEAHLEPLTLEAVGGSLCHLLTDHLGLLSQSAAFPEIAAPVLVHLRKHGKHCRSEALRRQLKGLVERCEASAAAVRARREQSAPAARLLAFEADTTMAKARAEAARRRAAEEKTRIEAERQNAPGEGQSAPRAARTEPGRKMRRGASRTQAGGVNGGREA